MSTHLQFTSTFKGRGLYKAYLPESGDLGAHLFPIMVKVAAKNNFGVVKDYTHTHTHIGDCAHPNLRNLEKFISIYFS